jgi:hypothetical protein
MCMDARISDVDGEQLAWQLYQEYGIRPRELLSVAKHNAAPSHDRNPRLRTRTLSLLNLLRIR